EANITNLSLNYDEYEDTQGGRKYHCIRRYYRELIVSGVFIFISLCGLVGNAVVIRFLGFHMKKSPFSVYVLNLAIADFSLLLFILVILTFYIVSAVNCFYRFVYERIKIILVVLFLFWYLASMYLLTAMSMERCLSVL
ncbi:MRGRD protein, partial [Stercorarius parasiticus]|nr:MRGRD protein [Stercorarius parasiticus]